MLSPFHGANAGSNPAEDANRYIAYVISTQVKLTSTAATSGMAGHQDTGCRIPRRSRPKTRQRIPKKWPIQIPLASCGSSP